MNKLFYKTLLASSLAVSSGAVFAQGSLNIYNWTDYTSPELIEAFEKETGIGVTIDTYDSNETLLAKLQAGGGGYDIAVSSHNFLPIMIKEGLLEEINAKESLSNFNNIDPAWRGLDFDPDNKYSIVWDYGSTAFSVNTAVVKGDINSYKLLFEPPEEAVGKIGMFDSPGDVISLAMIYLGEEMCTTDKEVYKKVLKLLEAQKPAVRVYNGDGTLERQTSGETVVHMSWNGYTIRQRTINPDIKYAYPKEGLLTWVDNLVVPKGAKNRDNAIKFLNFYSQAKTAAMQSNFAGYSVGVTGAVEYYKDEYKTAPEFTIPDGVEKLYQPLCSPEATKLYSKVWEKLKR